MNSVIAFEVSDGQEKIKNKMNELGYLSAWTANGKRYLLPSNMLWKQDNTLQQALEDIQTVIKNHNNKEGGGMIVHITLTKCIVLSSTPWIGMPETT